MVQSFVRVGPACVALLLMGCAGHRPAQPAQPPPSGETRSEFWRARDEPAPKLIAPPPAYGNKVVLARGPDAVQEL